MRGLVLVAVLSTGVASAQQATITVQTDGPTRPVSRYLTGACIEDVNHEIYGGIYSQMVFGESFQEPAPTAPVRGFAAYGGTWAVSDGELLGSGGDGPKLVSDATVADGEASVEILFGDRAPGLAGLIVRVGRPGVGPDNFDGYEVALDPAAQSLRLGRHRRNWELLRDVPVAVPVGEWVTLAVRMEGATLEVLADGKSVLRHADAGVPLLTGAVGLRQWQREARYRNLTVTTGDGVRALAFEAEDASLDQVSGMWRPVRRGSAEGAWLIEREEPFVGAQSQRVSFARGEGEVGVENQGLNRWGMHFEAGKPYEAVVWARSERGAELWLSLESADGSRVHAEQRLEVPAGGWQRLACELTPRHSESKGRLAVSLRRPGSVVLGYALLQPGEWGRFKGLPVRRDVAEGLIAQGITVLRCGGCMVNDDDYRWKRMIGPREQRQPYHGFWYPYSSNGWGIVDFVAFCRAAGFLCVPDFNMGESPEDMADFIEYANGSAESTWGRRRVQDGFPEPFALKYIQLGNEERVNDEYADRFTALAEAIWDRDPSIILVVGDFCYSAPIGDPYHFDGAAGGITSLAAQQRILALAKAHGAEVWFDVHLGTEGPGRSSEFGALHTYQAALEQVADGARHQVVVFEFNAGNHGLRRALANAEAIHLTERLGLPIATSANCLQPDGQNDNDWDQGLLFLNPSSVWLQPPGYITRMVSEHYQPLLLASTVEGPLDVSAKRGEDGTVLVLEVVNTSETAVEAAIGLGGYRPAKPEAEVEELAGPYDATNTAAEPDRIVPVRSRWQHGLEGGRTARTFAPRSFTVIVFR
jgi:hypothetical protein